jgi:hypothetical protein
LLSDARDPADDGLIVFENISGRALTKVMEYCAVHAGPAGQTGDLRTWDDRFVRLDPGTLCELASVCRLPLLL